MAYATSGSEEVLPPGCKHPTLQLEEITLSPAGEISLGSGDPRFCS